MYHIFFIYSSVGGHLGCFHVLAIVNSAALNIGVPVSFWIMVFSGYMPSSGIAGSYWKSLHILNCLDWNLLSCSLFFFFSISHSLVVSQACSVITFRGLKSCQFWRVWSSLGVIESVGIIAAKLFKWDSCSVCNYRFVLTDLFCRFLWAGILLGKSTMILSVVRVGDFPPLGWFVRRVVM